MAWLSRRRQKMRNCEIKRTLDETLAVASPSLARKALHAVDLLRKAERIALSYDKEDGYYLAFSGGKDSQALYHVAKLAGVRFKAHMNLTSVDPPEVIRFVRREYPDVDMIRPKASIYDMAIKKCMLPKRTARWCCKEYKETAGAGKVTLTGIRREESARRARRNEVEINSRKFSGDLAGLDEYRKKKLAEGQGMSVLSVSGEHTLGCISGKESLLISPILEWTLDEVWEFLGLTGASHCELYDIEGWTRIGCVCCPLASDRHKRMESERYPHVKRNWKRAIIQLYDKGYLSKNPWPGNTKDEIAENIYDWWMGRWSFKEWYARRIQQGRMTFDDDKDNAV